MLKYFPLDSTLKTVIAQNPSVGRLHHFRIFLAASITLFAVCLFATQDARAQAADLEPPTIALEEIEKGIAGEMQTFTATITDNQQLVSVVLFHRLAGDENYRSTEMLPIADSDIHSASVAITTDDPRDIEYYIQAEDFGGNKALKGFAFDPLVRMISPDVVAIATVAAGPTPASRNRKFLWGAIGLIAVVVLATQAGGSDSGGSAPPATEVPIDIEVNPVGGLGFSF